LGQNWIEYGLGYVLGDFFSKPHLGTLLSDIFSLQNKFSLPTSGNSDGGVAQWTSHPPRDQKTRVRISPERKISSENMAILCTIDLIWIVLCAVKFL
jgi:hypothetical protein